MTKKTFIFIILALYLASGSVSGAAVFGFSDGFWSVFPQTFIDSIRNCQGYNRGKKGAKTLEYTTTILR